MIHYLKGVSAACVWLFVVLAFVSPLDASVGAQYPSASPQVELKAIKLFESDDGYPEPHQRVYRTEFDHSESRFINFEMNLKNHAYGKVDNLVLVRWKYFSPNGELFGEDKRTYSFPKSSQFLRVEEGRGWNQTGYWDAGVYRIEIWMGDQLFTETSFRVIDDRSITKPMGDVYTEDDPMLKLYYLKTFNGQPERTSEEMRSIPKSQATYIYAEFGFQSLLYGIRDTSYQITYKYYTEGGTLAGEVETNLDVPKDWDYGWNQAGWGWEQPGNWPVGKHRVEVWIHGQRFAVRHFTITDN